MKQLLQDARTGELRVAEVPAPQLLPGCVLVRVEASLVSAGTERASAEFASKNLLAKAKARPDLVSDVLAKMRRDGLASTLQTVRSRLNQPQSVGYSSAGMVVAVGDGIADISVGDRVACAGAGYAVHAEFACVPRMLVAKISAGRETSSPVSSEEAAFGTVGAICQKLTTSTTWAIAACAAWGNWPRTSIAPAWCASNGRCVSAWVRPKPRT